MSVEPVNPDAGPDEPSLVPTRLTRGEERETISMTMVGIRHGLMALGMKPPFMVSLTHKEYMRVLWAAEPGDLPGLVNGDGKYVTMGGVTITQGTEPEFLEV